MEGESLEESSQDVPLPQKKFYRQRAHSNPLSDHTFQYPRHPDQMDWSKIYPVADVATPPSRVEFLDVGCGYGGLLIALADVFPQTKILGLEIRVKVSDYVHDRIKALQTQHPGRYGNISILRTNAMKYLPNFFHKGQLSKMFFLYPDPHFKKSKHKWRIIRESIMAEYAYTLRLGGVVYTVTDVRELHEWMSHHFTGHPLFDEVPADELASDPVYPLLRESSEEGKKVARAGGEVYIASYRRVKDPFTG